MNTKEITFAESILIQANGDLSDEEFRSYMAKLAQDEITKDERLPEKMTIATLLDLVEKVKFLCEEIHSDYDTAMDDPENDISGWHITDKANDFLHNSSNQESQARAIARIGMTL